MPIKINDHLSAICQLQEEGIFTMTEQRATTQRIRPLKVCVLNLMPLKKPTEIQLLRLLGNSPLQIEVDFCRTVSRETTHTDIRILTVLIWSLTMLRTAITMRF